VFAQETSPDSAARLARRIVAAMELPIVLNGSSTITVGASVGLATATADKVVHQADLALYQAKRDKRIAPSTDLRT
jgi:GGDEF domain-containing protein